MSVSSEIQREEDKVEYAFWDFTVKSLEGNRAAKNWTILKNTNELDLSTKLNDEESIDAKCIFSRNRFND